MLAGNSIFSGGVDELEFFLWELNSTCVAIMLSVFCMAYHSYPLTACKTGSWNQLPDAGRCVVTFVNRTKLRLSLSRSCLFQANCFGVLLWLYAPPCRSGPFHKRHDTTSTRAGMYSMCGGVGLLRHPSPKKKKETLNLVPVS